MCRGTITDFYCPCTSSVHDEDTPTDAQPPPLWTPGEPRLGHKVVRSLDAGAYIWCDAFFFSAVAAINAADPDQQHQQHQPGSLLLLLGAGRRGAPPDCPDGPVAFDRHGFRATALCERCLDLGCRLDWRPRGMYGYPVRSEGLEQQDGPGGRRRGGRRTVLLKKPPPRPPLRPAGSGEFSGAGFGAGDPREGETWSGQVKKWEEERERGQAESGGGLIKRSPSLRWGLSQLATATSTSTSTSTSMSKPGEVAAGKGEKTRVSEREGADLAVTAAASAKEEGEEGEGRKSEAEKLAREGESWLKQVRQWEEEMGLAELEQGPGRRRRPRANAVSGESARPLFVAAGPSGFTIEFADD